MSILDTRNKFLTSKISKPEFIKMMYELHHFKLFEYVDYIKQTNIASIEISNDDLIMTSRDTGVKIICPLGDYRVAPIEALNFLDYETIDSAMIMQLVPSEGCVIDIGANIGWYSINIAKKYPLTKVHAFEPIPKTYSFFERNVKLNRLENITTQNFGLSNERKDITFYFYPEGGVNASSANLSDRSDTELITCHVERLDDYVKDNKLHVNFIKCDVEGAELFAFQGAKKTLQRDQPIVFAEMLRKWAAKFNYHPNEIIMLFSSFGYRCFYAYGKALKELSAIDDETLETNFFFLHSEKHEQLISELLKL
jgi:FkbM family methyltransferase